MVFSFISNCALGEYTSVVIEVGAKSFRMGYGGDDRPVVVMPSYVGRTKDGKKIFGEVALSSTSCVEIEPIVVGSGFSMPLLEDLLNHGMQILGMAWEDAPTLWIENPTYEASSREAIAKLLFGKFKVPALYFCASPIVMAFSQGKHTALIVDFGETSLRICPVRDGMLLKPSCIYEHRQSMAKLRGKTQSFLGSMGTELRIHQQVLKKHPCGLGKPASFEQNPIALSPSFLNYHTSNLVDDFIETIVQVSENTMADEKELSMRPPKYYEFPDGFNQSFGLERFQLGETWFAATDVQKTDKIDSSEVAPSLPELVRRSLEGCIPEIRRDLQSNIILVGGGSSLPGLAERLSNELGGQVRVHLPSTINERRISAWIGGSILSSLSNFQPMWILLNDFQENEAQTIRKLQQ